MQGMGYFLSMTSLNELFEKLWSDYAKINPQADEIHRLLEARGEKVINDHVAFRTYDDPRIDLKCLSRIFLKLGYVERETYRFEEKKLLAKHFEHPLPEKPKVFISELKLKEFSKALQTRVKEMIDQVPKSLVEDDGFCFSGRPWKVKISDYENFSKESEYAAWMAAFGFRANHFTVFVNSLKTFGSLAELNQFLKSKGYALNDSGGEIKGSKEVYLEQSSTKAAVVNWQFDDGPHRVPSCYYEFAKRYPAANGQLYQGFVEKSADKIFESTDRGAM